MLAELRRKWATARSWRRLVASEWDWFLTCVLHCCGRHKWGRFASALPLRLRDGKRIRVRPGSSDFATFREVFAERVYGVFVEFDQPCSGVLDLGANVGLMARWLLTEQPSARIFCVEPDPGNCDLAHMNLAAEIHDGSVVLTQSFAGGVARKAWIASRGISAANEGRISDRPVADSPPIPVKTIPELIQDAPFAIDTIKIDIEGAEREIFEADLTWLQGVRNVIMEVHAPLDELWLRRVMESQPAHTIRKLWCRRPEAFMVWLAATRS